MRTFNFKQMISTGQEGEKIVMSWFEEQGCIVQDCRDDPAHRERGIDFTVGRIGIEVKTDTHPPINLFIELTVDGKEGWLEKCQADILAYYFPEGGIIYLLSMPLLRGWVRANIDRLLSEQPWREREITSTGAPGSKWKTGGVLVPIRLLRKDMEIKEIRV